MRRMPNPRRFVWALVATLCATLALAAPTSAAGGDPFNEPTVLDPGSVCSPGQMPTQWTDELHPPPTVRVLRSRGPVEVIGTVQTVPFWEYVGRVVRAEYSSGSDKPYPWMHIGALTVKQYAWYYAGHWRGGRVTRSNPDLTTTTYCYDLKDTTADQIFTDLKKDKVTGEWVEANAPTPANLKAMRETWHMTLRKWQVDKNQSRLFLSGYRSGKQKPCGADSTGFKIYQKSLRDCGIKKMTLEETLRAYYEPNALHVTTRRHDVQADNSAWSGDLGVLVQSGNNSSYRLYRGSSDSFTAGPTGTLSGTGTVLGQGVGNVDSADSNGADDSKLLADLVMLVNGNGRKLLTARATTDGLAQPLSQPAPAASEKLLVADFDGDLLSDAGLLSTEAGVRRLVVMRATGNGAFSDPIDWWVGPVELGQDAEMAGDTNGDGKADLIMRSTSGFYFVATSRASCSDLTAWGTCPAAAVGAHGLNYPAVWLSTFTSTDVKNIVGDYDRDGRDDVIAVKKDGTGIQVVGLLAKTDGSLADPLVLWSGNVPFGDVLPMAMDVNPDGMADLALVQKEGAYTRVRWLRTIERSTSPASMATTTSGILDGGLPWSQNNRPF